MARASWRWVVPLLLSMSVSVADAQEWQRLGLLRVRDMTPFGLSRLDFLPAHAVSATPGTFAVEANLSYQNTWARSDNVNEYLKDRGLQRSGLSPADVAAIVALPGDAYLVDGEYGLVDLTLHYRVSSHFGVYATVPFLFFDDGTLDGLVESFHSQFGFDNAGREFLPHNQWYTLLDLQRTTVIMDQPPKNAFGDPVFGIRYALKEKPENWNLILETAVKVARGDPRPLVSTGSTDYGMQVSLQRFFSRHALYLTLSEVYYSTPDVGMSTNRWIPTLVAGWETQFTQRLSFVLQLYASRSTVQETNLHELSATKLQATMGLQWLYRGQVLRVGLTENLGSFNNTPDVGLTLSVGRIFGSSH